MKGCPVWRPVRPRARPGRRFGNGGGTWCAWYVRKIKVPQAWAGRAVLLSLQRVSTDAIVYVNGKKCGAITWPSGEMDLTSAVTPGGEDTLWIEVMASRRGPASGALDSSQVDLIDLYGQNGGQAESTRVDTKGLVGDVLLCSRPQGAHISDVFIQPSTRQKQLKVEVELSGAAAGPVHFIAHLMDEQGKEEKTFEADASVPEGAPQTVTLSWPWANPRLWDVQQPNLYTLKLEAKGGGLNDEFAQSFGFREFWIEGRNFFMNGTEIHLRPTGCRAGRRRRRLALPHQQYHQGLPVRRMEHGIARALRCRGSGGRRTSARCGPTAPTTWACCSSFMCRTLPTTGTRPAKSNGRQTWPRRCAPTATTPPSSCGPPTPTGSASAAWIWTPGTWAASATFLESRVQEGRRHGP